MVKQPFNNDSTPAERRRIVRETASYHALAAAEAGVKRGRYGAIGKEYVTGTGSGYPQQREDSWPNQAATVPDEPPLGIDVNALEPVGAEIQESLTRSGTGDPPSGPDGEGALRKAPRQKLRPRRPNRGGKP